LQTTNGQIASRKAKKMDSALSEALRRGNPVVFFDVAIGGAPAGRMRMELFKRDCPRTVENFRNAWKPDAELVCALQGDGTGRISIYGDKFSDENFIHKHTEAGLLSMVRSDEQWGWHSRIPHATVSHRDAALTQANSGPGTNGCQFFFTCAPCDWLDGKHVVFGRLLDPASLLLLRKMESVPVGPNSKPKLAISITECGEL
ncbi:hypothetical protein BBJ28_00015968, partial [Nothophytophthora sp. Chile5]